MYHDHDDICFLSAVELAARIRAGKVSPVEVIEALRGRIKQRESEAQRLRHPRPG